MVVTPDPEIELEEVERNKKLGKAEEDDIFRDLNLYEILTSVTDEITYKTWFLQHLERVWTMIPAGLRVLGIYSY